MKLITLQQARGQLRMTHTSEDAQIDEAIEEASAAIVRYLNSGADEFLDSSGEPDALTDTDGLTIIGYVVPPDVRRACKITIEEWWKNRGGAQDGAVDSQFGYGYSLPRAAIALLYPYRTPTLR